MISSDWLLKRIDKDKKIFKDEILDLIFKEVYKRLKWQVLYNEDLPFFIAEKVLSISVPKATEIDKTITYVNLSVLYKIWDKKIKTDKEINASSLSNKSNEDNEDAFDLENQEIGMWSYRFPNPYFYTKYKQFIQALKKQGLYEFFLKLVNDKIEKSKMNYEDRKSYNKIFYLFREYI